MCLCCVSCTVIHLGSTYLLLDIFVVALMTSSFGVLELFTIKPASEAGAVVIVGLEY